MFCTIDGVRLFYQTVGAGPHLVMLHGWAQDTSTFWPLVDLLSGSFRLWLLDLPGFGRSGMSRNPMTVSDYASVVRGFVEQHQLGRPGLVGHSFGGRVAIKLASRHPDIVRRLLLVDAPAFRASRSFGRTALYVASTAIRLCVPEWFDLRTRARRRFYRAIGSDYLDAADLRQTFVAVVSEDLTEDIQAIDAEVLVVWGEQDRAVPLREGIRLYQLLKHARIEVFEGVGHFPHVENPMLFAHYVRYFF